MKNKHSLFIFIAAYLAILIPSPGRFVYGIVIMLELFLLTIFGTLINSLINKLKIQEIKTVVIMLILISTAIFYRQLITILYPEIALVLGFVFYLLPVSLFLVGNVFNDLEKPLAVRLVANIKHVLIFIITGILFFLFRDIAGYGTFTFFGKNHQIYEKVILNPEGIGIFSFFASIPGALILAGIILFLDICIREKFAIIRNSEAQNDVH